MSEMRFGEVWRKNGSSFWDGMWERHKDSPMTKRVTEIAMEAKSLCEVGCGYGHFVQSLIQKGWRGRFIGYEMSPEGARRTKKLCDAADIDASVRDGDFLVNVNCSTADVAMSRAVIQHQSHWMPMTLAMLRLAPVAVLAIGYVSDSEYHKSSLHKDGHYDVWISPELLEREALAAGLKVEIECFYNDVKKRKEILAIIERA